MKSFFQTGVSAVALLAAGPVYAQATADAAAPPLGTAAAPQDDSGDIIVTATRQETSLQKTPIAVSVFSQAQLDRQQVNNPADLQRFVPSLQFNKQAEANAVLITLRGIGNDNSFTESADPEVALYIDGIYAATVQGGTALLYDLERLEVLRGPQGTLFGRNTTAGALNLTTAKPRLDKFSGSVELIGGSYDRVGARGSVNIPVSDTLAVRFAFATEQHKGYVSYQAPPVLAGLDNTVYITSGPRYNAQYQQSARFSALWRPSSRFRWDLNVEGFLDNGSPAAALMQTPRPGQNIWSILADTAPDNDRYAVAVRSNMTYEIGDHAELSYIAGYTRTGGTEQTDSDVGVVPPLTNGAPTLYASERNQTVFNRFDFYSHELQLKSRGTDAISWIVGGYYSHNKAQIRADIDDRDGNRSGPSSFSVSFIQPGYNVTSYAGFGQGTWKVTPKLNLTGGLRYSVDEKESLDGGAVYLFGCPTPPTPGAPPCRGVEGQYPGTTGPQLAQLLGPDFLYVPSQGQGTFKKLTYLARVDYNLTNDALLYASVGTGFKSGVIDQLNRVTGPETLTDYELGTKLKLFDRKLTLNLAAYYYDFKGYQVGQIEVVRDANGNILSTVLATLNADGATNYGFEAEAVWAVTPQDRIQFAGAVQKTKLKSLVTIDQRFDGDPTDPAAQRQLRGNELPHAPRFSATLTYEHDFEMANGGKITPRGTVHYETASFLTIFNGDRTNRVVNGQLGGYGTAFDKQKAYTLSDLAIRYTSPGQRYILEAFVQNLEDRKIRTSSTTYGPALNGNSFLSYLQPPRTFGARLQAKF